LKTEQTFSFLSTAPLSGKYYLLGVFIKGQAVVRPLCHISHAPGARKSCAVPKTPISRTWSHQALGRVPWRLGMSV
jgi:hypothetical protein